MGRMPTSSTPQMYYGTDYGYPASGMPNLVHSQMNSGLMLPSQHALAAQSALSYNQSAYAGYLPTISQASTSFDQIPSQSYANGPGQQALYNDYIANMWAPQSNNNNNLSGQPSQDNMFGLQVASGFNFDGTTPFEEIFVPQIE